MKGEGGDADEQRHKKEAVSRTYQGFDGYTPIAAYLGNEGWGVGLDLRPGKQHSALHTEDFLKEVFPRVERLVPTTGKVLSVSDSGFDSACLLFAHEQERERYLAQGRSKDKSPLSEYFAEGGLSVADNREVPCTIVVGATVSLPLNPSDPESVRPLPADFILNHEEYKSQMAEAALQSTTLAQEASEQDKTHHTIGQNVDAIIGSNFGMLMSAGLAGIGSLFDGKKKRTSCWRGGCLCRPKIQGCPRQIPQHGCRCLCSLDDQGVTSRPTPRRYKACCR